MRNAELYLKGATAIYRHQPVLPELRCFSQSDCAFHGSFIIIIYKERVTRDMPFVHEIRLDAV